MLMSPHMTNGSFLSLRLWRISHIFSVNALMSYPGCRYITPIMQGFLWRLISIQRLSESLSMLGISVWIWYDILLSTPPDFFQIASYSIWKWQTIFFVSLSATTCGGLCMVDSMLDSLSILFLKLLMFIWKMQMSSGFLFLIIELKEIRSW